MSTPNLSLLLSLGLAVASFAAHSATLPDNGWAQWQTERLTSAPSYCCIDWNGDADRARHGGQTYCDLNQKQQGFSSIKSDPNPTMQIFAHFESGKLTEVRSLSTTCEIRNREQAVQLGTLSTTESVALLTNAARPADGDRHDRGMLMLSVASHPGQLALNWLEAKVRSQNGDDRQDALFWLGQVRASEARETLKYALMQDTDTAMRRHACFVVAESGLAERFDWLRDAAKQDADRSVRHDAWFWFGQAKPANAEQVLTAALRETNDHSTRNHLVFVLSQLPAPRGTDALVALLTNQQASAEVRKQALFWLGQSDDPRALAALDRYL